VLALCLDQRFVTDPVTIDHDRVGLISGASWGKMANVSGARTKKQFVTGLEVSFIYPAKGSPGTHLGEPRVLIVSSVAVDKVPIACTD
jgi:hypothetical protein